MPRRRRIYTRLLPLVTVILATAAVILVLASSGGPAPSANQSASTVPPLRATPAIESTHKGATSTTTTRAPVVSRRLPSGVARGSRHDVVHMLGQMIVARFVGPRPSAAFLERIRSGQIGGVILFADNVAGGVAQTHALTTELQDAARLGGNPPLLIMTDQEGGAVRRLPGPPDLSPAAMTSDRMAFDQGITTGRLLKAAGINVDLAPVADVEHAHGSFLGSRAFGSDPSIVATRACSFAQGLQSQGIAYTLKHFPGLGRATGNTDTGPVAIDAPSSLLRQDYLAYVNCANSPFALVMVSSATYPNLTGPRPAVMSPLTYSRELRIVSPQAPDLTISDDLEAGALHGQSAPARQAINAGLDLLIYAQTEQGSGNAYKTLTRDARTGTIRPARIREAFFAIETLKRHLATA